MDEQENVDSGPKIHVHVYKIDIDHELVDEQDLALIEYYQDLDDGPVGEIDHDGYFQFGFERNGEWIEIRVRRSTCVELFELTW